MFIATLTLARMWPVVRMLLNAFNPNTKVFKTANKILSAHLRLLAKSFGGLLRPYNSCVGNNTRSVPVPVNFAIAGHCRSWIDVGGRFNATKSRAGTAKISVSRASTALPPACDRNDVFYKWIVIDNPKFAMICSISNCCIKPRPQPVS